MIISYPYELSNDYSNQINISITHIVIICVYEVRTPKICSYQIVNKTILQNKVFMLPVMVVHACDPNTWEAEVGGLNCSRSDCAT
jgi:hypothetical protein